MDEKAKLICEIAGRIMAASYGYDNAVTKTIAVRDARGIVEMVMAQEEEIASALNAEQNCKCAELVERDREALRQQVENAR